MAYLDRPPLNQRLANLGTAGLIELGLIAALIAGLSITIAPRTPDPKMIPIDYKTPPPPTNPPPTADPIDTVIDTVTPPIDVTKPDQPKTPTVENTPAPYDGPTVFATPSPPKEPTVPRFTASPARPANNTARWVTTEDYPAGPLRRGEQGTTKFWVEVGTNGRVKRCEVIGSSGSRALDDTACAKITSRARFKPATDGSGAKVGGTYSSSVVWRIP